MANMIPYLHFNGTCREAMGFYQRCLGGDLVMQSFGEVPGGDQMPAEARDNIMHAMLTSGAVTLFGADSMHGSDVAPHGPVSLALTSEDKGEIRGYFEKLSEGGTIAQPLEEAFFGLYGEIVDRFGVRWMFQGGQAA